jgi:hypothetical protein
MIERKLSMTLTLGSLQYDHRQSRARLSALQKKLTDKSLSPSQKKALMKALPLQKKVLEGRKKLVRLKQQAERL